MQKFLITLCSLIFFAILPLNAQEAVPKRYQNRYNDVMNRTEWWRNDRFGMFIHFGAYAVPARGEWVKSQEKLTTEQYQQYVDQFYPYAYDAREWARIAKKAGMKYAVLTAKHHDGFCLFDSKYTEYKLTPQFDGRDLVREFLDAFRAEGLKVGLYYSLIDWHHPDYPNVGNHPMRDNEAYGKQKFDFDAYLTYMHNQVEELVTDYGKIDIMWFDYSFGEYAGEKWKASELLEMVYKHQPQIILDNRLSPNHGMSTEMELAPFGDFITPEQGVPEKPIVDKYGNYLPWETCLTLNNNWGYAASDDHWKSPELIVHTLVECVSKNGNLLLNVGPDATGRIPDPSQKILKEVGRWMEKNHESIYGAGLSTFEKPEWGRLTQNGNRLYVHWLYPKVGHIYLRGFADKVKYATLLYDGSEAHTSTGWWGEQNSGKFFLNVDEPTYQTFPLPDPYDTVFKLILTD